MQRLYVKKYYIVITNPQTSLANTQQETLSIFSKILFLNCFLGGKGIYSAIPSHLHPKHLDVATDIIWCCECLKVLYPFILVKFYLVFVSIWGEKKHTYINL